MTVATVGYGDVYPVTFGGRCIAVAMMICGIALLGTITAIIASWMVEQVRAEEQAPDAATRAQVEHLSDQIERLQQRLVGGLAGPDEGVVPAVDRSVNGGVRGVEPVDSGPRVASWPGRVGIGAAQRVPGSPGAPPAATGRAGPGRAGW